jgi:hypothetical protein
MEASMDKDLTFDGVAIRDHSQEPELDDDSGSEGDN